MLPIRFHTRPPAAAGIPAAASATRVTGVTGVTAVVAVVAVVVCALTLASPAAHAAPANDTFETYAPGAFPAPAWTDFATFVGPIPNYPPPVLPSMTVVLTTDAFGHATQAVQTVDTAAGAVKGIYALQAHASTLTVSADVRVLRYSDSNPSTVKPWQDGAGIALFKVDPSNSPFLQVYASSTTHRWRLDYTGDAAVSPDVDDYALSGAADLDTWYHVLLEFDRQAGTFHTRITNIAAGTFVDDVINPPNWQPGIDDFNGVLFNSGEASATLAPGPGAATVSNIAQFDNINVAPVPEPQTWALLLLGLGAFSLRQRRARP